MLSGEQLYEKEKVGGGTCETDFPPTGVCRALATVTFTVNLQQEDTVYSFPKIYLGLEHFFPGNISGISTPRNTFREMLV